MVRHQIRPGMTGWAQICGLRGDTSIKDRIEHDIYYAEHWSVLFDIKIMFITLFGGKFINKEE
jgi:lipopolysaccharide/colanic/teichoic acid biosynthesis glycosyltransferase